MAEAIQACERTPGQDTCPFHPGHKITTLCKTCGILVCLECMVSNEHQEHRFKKISECLREPTNSIARYLTDIDNNILVTVDRELDAVQIERKESVQKHTESVQSLKKQQANLRREIDTTTNHMVAQMDKHLQEVLDSLDKHLQELESLRKYLIKERKDNAKVLEDGSEILKFDVGNAAMNKVDKTKMPKHLNIPDLQHIECKNSEEMIRKALGTLRELSPPSTSMSTIAKSSKEDLQTGVLEYSTPVVPTPEQKPADKYSAITTQSTWSNEEPEYCQITPITKDTAWARLVSKSNSLHLISSTGKGLREVKTDWSMICLSLHPTTGQLYGGYQGRIYNRICIIATESGKLTRIIKCDIKPEQIKVTKDDDVLFGATGCPVYRYKLTGDLIQESPEKYNVCDLDQCTRTNRVVLSCKNDGVMILNYNLNKTHNFTGLAGPSRKKFVCNTAVFDSDGNIIVGDWSNKDVYILDSNQYTLIQKLPIKDMSNPLMLKLNNNMLWVQCHNPRKVMCLEF